MRYLALACDYDGTLAHDGRVSKSTVEALKKFRASGRRLLLVTGRELDDLARAFPEFGLFERIVAENGALLHTPETRETKVLAERPPEAFVSALRAHKVSPLSVGHVIVATWKPYETAVLESIRDLGLDLQVIFNKDAVMVLPASVNKATGLRAALEELELSPHEVVGVGDAENDHAFLSLCECGVAVSNALPMVKQRADLVTEADHGGGVEFLIEQILDNDLQVYQNKIARHRILLGHTENGEEVGLAPFGCNVLIAGPSSSGKSTISKGILERLHEQRYQFCIIDPEGDYDGLEGAVTIGDAKRGPTVDEIMQLLKKPDVNAVVNLVGLPLADRPGFFMSLLPRLQEMRSRLARPHWLVIDETHHLMPAAWEPGRQLLPREIDRMVFLTVHPDEVSVPVLEAVSTLIAVGAEPEKTIGRLCAALQQPTPQMAFQPIVEAEPGVTVVWEKSKGANPIRVNVVVTRAEHRRHTRKYAEGELPADRCFYFRGSNNKLNIRVQNLILFNQIAEGVDDATWLHHLRKHDYSRWFRAGIHDVELADEAEKIEQATHASPKQSRQRIKELIERFYTLPAATGDKS